MPFHFKKILAVAVVGFLAFTVFSSPEIDVLRAKETTFQELPRFFTKLAEDKGAAYAYEVLKVADLPPQTDFHLLGHFVGDVLYKQQGLDGIKICTQNFRNACSHSIVVGLFSDKGEQALPEIAKACREAPGGTGAYTMCFHGLGHGILTYTGYDMVKATELCNKTGTKKYNNREAIECVGGTVMEIIGGGFHDIALWGKQSKKYLSSEDPLSLCKNDFIPNEAKPQCYLYLTPHLFKMAGANARKPEPKDYEKAFTFCDALPTSDALDRSACFGGFGKEFVVLSQDRDIRKTEQMTDGQLKNVYEWCTLTKNIGGVQSCIVNAMNSLFWGGENDVGVSIRFCNAISDSLYKNICFNNLIRAVRFYKQDRGYQKEFCNKLPKQYYNSCNSRN